MIAVVIVFTSLTRGNFQKAAVAQGNPSCNFDLSEVSALLVKSQTKASGGDVAAGLELLTQAQDKLAQIKAQCSSQGSSTPTLDFPNLTQTFSPTDGSYHLQYPQGWIASPLNSTSVDKKAPKPILLASNQATVEALNNNIPADALNGIAVYVGTQQQVIIELGAFKQDIQYDALDAKGLLDSVIASTPVSSGAAFGPPEMVSIGTRQGAMASFSFSPTGDTKNKAKYDGLFLILPLSGNQFAALVGITTPGQTKAIQALVQAVAATVKLS